MSYFEAQTAETAVVQMPPTRLVEHARAVGNRLEMAQARWYILKRLHSDHERLSIDGPALALLWNMTFEALVLDLGVCWDKSKDAVYCFPAIGRKLGDMQDKRVADYIGGDERVRCAKLTAAAITKAQTDLKQSLETVYTLRDRFITHAEVLDTVKAPVIEANHLDKILYESKLLLLQLHQPAAHEIGRTPDLDATCKGFVEALLRNR